MLHAIVYTSNAGSTARYAQLLGQVTVLPIFSAQEAHKNLANGDILNFIELSEEYSIMECRCPRQWQGKSIRELDVRARHRLNIIAIRRGGGMTISPGGEYALQEEDELVVLGRNEDIREVERL